MPTTRTGYVRDGDGAIIGEFREITGDDGNTFRREEIDRGDGMMKVVVETMDGVRKEGTVEPGGAADRGLGA